MSQRFSMTIHEDQADYAEQSCRFECQERKEFGFDIKSITGSNLESVTVVIDGYRIERIFLQIVQFFFLQITAVKMRFPLVVR